MAERRMFSKKIVDSARFLKMPPSTQALYFHLGLRADDDGIVEAYAVLRLIGATEDDLKLLVAKGFAIVLNEDLVTYITDWNEHNKIRADRKVDSVYKDLLLRIVPEIPLIEPKERADRKKDVLGTSQGQQLDGIGKDRIGKVSRGKVSIPPGPEQDAPPPKVAASFLLNDGTLYDVTENDVEKFQQLYPGIDVMQEIRKIVGWCDSNPKNRKTRGGAKRFINGWLSRSQDRAGKVTVNRAPSTNRFHNFDQRDTDYDALLMQEEKGLYGGGK